MTKSSSSIEPTIDFTANGKHEGFLKLPHSVHRSAYGYIPLPVVSIKNGTGPTVLYSAGVHGDEFEGQVALCKLAKEITPDRVNGQIIILPMTNFPAARAGLRTSPLDDLNLNREFPGDPFGTPTRQIAYYVETVLMDMADYSFDIHSGGSSLHYLPTVLYRGGEAGNEELARREELVATFGAPFAIEMPSSGLKGSGSRATMAAAERQNALGIGGEFGGSGTVTPECLKVCELGLRRLLNHLGVWCSETPPPVAQKGDTIYLNSNSKNLLVFADQEGLFEPAAQLGNRVTTGQTAGFLHHPDTPWRVADEIKFEAAGLILAKRIPGLAERGDCLFHLGKIVT
jgi:predicted deacylase